MKKEGLDFLGFHFIIINTKSKGNPTSKNLRKPFVLFGAPSKENVIEHYRNMRRVVWKHKGHKLFVLIKT